MIQPFKKCILSLLFIAGYNFCFCQNDIVRSIFFAKNSASIDSSYKETLAELAKACSSKNFCYVRIFGFADTTGTEEHNDELSGKRVEAVYEFLSSYCKLNSENSYATWIGESAEAYDLHFEEANVRKRCVDIWVSFCGRKP